GRWALVADLDRLATLAEGNGRRLSETFAEVVALGVSGAFSDRITAVRAGAGAFLETPTTSLDIFEAVEKRLASAEEPPLKVLIVDDDPIAARVAGRPLEQAGMEVVIVSDPMWALDKLCSFRPDLAVLDLYMPQCSGTELARVIRQISSFDSLPIVFLSSEQELARQMAALSTGGDDFIAKGTPPARLIPLIRARAARMRKLRRQMHMDPMTRLLTHTAFKDALDHEVASATRGGRSLCLAMVDIDHFKSINDSHGHPVGDVVIKSLARLLRNRTRTSDHVGRFGGEEFGVALPGASLSDAVSLLESLRETFSHLQHRSGGGLFRTAFSAGVAEWRSGERTASLISRADQALYRAKANGRNRVVSEAVTGCVSP
ncbi:MAG: diguanylate cyclase, partial [Rhodospirillales bacterium]|nr:diguanylate cyclase [Rhodospirillales bacterium]